MKTSAFSLRPFDQTPRFSISEFSDWGKNSEFDQNALRLIKTTLIKVSYCLERVLVT